ncbi:competence protein ComFC [Cetobacterium ceti]|uniref:Competence protein ComFC n=1 Tax=Cetobacterium ceti TaxID=180163 RepID=A0A1T4L163_9FUSO|nr:phosphoribosyltransferase family protein [Cetobacterium ceti]SJZ48331.1 competence protein ComFC [Cetobacterium ceti]
MKRNLSRNIKRILFDEKCSLCGKILKYEDKDYICLQCYKNLLEMGEIKKQGDLYYLYYYDDIKKVIWDFKFKNRRYLGNVIGEILKRKIIFLRNNLEVDYIIPIPISEKRKLERGFNQVEEILKEASVEYLEIKRIKNTKPMYSLKTIEKREENLRESFYIPQNIEDKVILVVDDIVTTGSTFSEIERELKKKKPKKIFYFSLTMVKKYLKKIKDYGV